MCTAIVQLLYLVYTQPSPSCLYVRFSYYMMYFSPSADESPVEYPWSRKFDGGFILIQETLEDLEEVVRIEIYRADFF